MDIAAYINLIFCILVVFIGSIEIQGCGSKESSTRGAARTNSTDTTAVAETAVQAYKQTAPAEVKDGGKFKICRAASTDGKYKLAVQRTLKTGETEWKVKLVGEKCGDKTGSNKEIADDLAKDLQGEDVPCKTVWAKFQVTADNPSRLKALCTESSWLGEAAPTTEERKLREMKSSIASDAALASGAGGASHSSSSSSSSSRTSVRKKWSRMVPGTPGDTAQSCDASAGAYHLVVKRLKRGGQNNYEVSMMGNKCGTDTIPETPLNGENTAKLQEDNISCTKVWEALGVTTATSTEDTLSDMCAKLKGGQL
ncbi:hypothetical protein FOZ60_011812 [Perkinsus olseni]|uniref:Uncharacterized protein n=1 Tax=Perkinsus olseni TaxID=32597 RepID=A0A7J6PNQ1_PEROL|nr:hypothetical protein FOZ60_011812 [Perkinsus olseni]